METQKQLSLLDRAICFAVNAHSGMHRKSTDIPYILHPMEAAAIVGTITTDTEVIAAAVLHDTVEDTDVTQEDLRREFGERVALLVGEESENKRENLPAESTWKIRKEETLEHLRSHASYDAKVIALGDKLSNLRSIHRDYDRLGDALWDRFNQKNMSQHGWYYRSIADILAPDLGHTAAWKEYRTHIDSVFGTEST